MNSMTPQSQAQLALASNGLDLGLEESWAWACLRPGLGLKLLSLNTYLHQTQENLAIGFNVPFDCKCNVSYDINSLHQQEM